MKRDSDRWLRIWLLALNVAVLGAGLVWAWTGQRRAMFLVAFVPIALGPVSYARLRVHRSLRRYLGSDRASARALIAFGIAGVICDVVMLAQLLTARSTAPIPILQSSGVTWVGAVWFSAHALFLVGLGVAALGRGIGAGGRRLVRRRARSAPPPLEERRAFLRQMSVMSVGAPFALSLSGVPLSYDFRVEEREVHLKGWPPELDGMRVAHLSDIHVGGAMNQERLDRVAELTNQARPDLVLHTGDFLTHRAGDFDLPLYRSLARIRAPLGQWACLGNHDYDDVAKLVRRLGDAGVRTLRDELVSLDLAGVPFEVGGLDYSWDRGNRGSIYTSTIGRWAPRNGPRILLNHDPSAFATLPDGCAELVCSGHTHGGHIGIQLGRDQALTVVGLVGIPDQGLFDRGDMRMFVTRCVGFYGYPMRLGIPPEISLLVLRSGERSG